MAPRSQQRSLQLPHGLLNQLDIGRLQRELEKITTLLQQAKIQKQKTDIPAISHLLREFCEINDLSIQEDKHREYLLQTLTSLRTTAPVLHISFAVDPSAAFVSKLVVWLRDNIHPYALVTIGLQPTLGAGCAVRTANKYFDFSLRERLQEKRSILIERLAQTEVAAKEVA